MLKNISLIIAVSIAVTACGGSDSGGKKSSSSVATSSAPSSVVASSSLSSVASSAPASITPSSVSSSSEVATSSVSSSSSSAAATADLSYGFAEGIAGWFVNGEANETTLLTSNLSLEHDLVNSALKISSLNWASDNWRRFAKFNMGAVHDTTGATFTVVVNVPQSYITDAGLEFQWIVADADNSGTQYGGNIKASTMTAGDNTLTITNRNVVDAKYIGLQLTTPPNDTSIKDPILIKSVEVNFAELAGSSSSNSSSSSPATDLTKVDFEADVAGTVYSGLSYSNKQDLATVTTISSVTGLPANGSSTNVLRISADNYNAGPLFNLTIPAGKTLGDYNVMLDAYLPRNSLGLTGNGNNFYKPLILVAGTELTGVVADTNTAYLSQVGTAGNVDVWHTFTLGTNNSSLTGAIKIALGVSRPKGSSDDDYYFDNIRLEAK